MNEQQQIWFNSLTNDREKSAETHEQISEAGYWRSVVDKYSEEAHFIYELLQNADDCEATEVHFDLKEEGLFFSHNGKIKFSLSDPKNEFKDTKNNNLGHINSLCSVGNSTKTEQQIGKFGLGFKSVFQFTQTPYIWDINFQFKVERFIVPQLLSNQEKMICDDFQDKNSQTIFWFPFDHKEHVEKSNFDSIDDEKEYIYHFTWQNKQKTKEQAFQDISKKLNDLVHPTLFLSNLKNIFWKINSQGQSKYEVNIISKTIKDEITYKKIKSNNVELFIFSKYCNFNHHNYEISVGFTMKNDFTKLISKKNVLGINAFCFFPAKSEITNLNFIFNAPFLLTDDRERIDKKETSFEFNSLCVNQIATLAADSLLILKEMELIDDNIFELLPYKNTDYGDNGFYNQIYKSIKEKFQTEELLPSNDGTYVKKVNAYWAEYAPIAKLISNQQLANLVNNIDAKWVFPSISRNEARYRAISELGIFIDDLINGHFDFERILRYYINQEFIKNQSFEWLHIFYKYISNSNDYIKLVKYKPIFINENREVVSAFDENQQPILFLPSDNNLGYNTIKKEFLENDDTVTFLKNFGIKQPSLKNEIYTKILPKYNSNEGIDTKPHFEIFFKYWKTEGKPDDFINMIIEKPFLIYKTNQNETKFRGKPSEIYYTTTELEKYFKKKSDTKFVDLEEYHSFITDADDRITVKDFLIKLGVSETPRILVREISDKIEKGNIKSIEGKSLEKGTNGYKGQGTFDKIIDGCKEVLEEIEIDGCKEVLEEIEKKNLIDNSILLWNYLCKLRLSDLKGIHKYFRNSQKVQYFESTSITLLKSKKWLLSRNNEFVAPNEITIDYLDDRYERNGELEKLLDFEDNKEKDIVSTLSKFGIEIKKPEDTQQLKDFLALDPEKRKEFLDKNKMHENNNKGFFDDDSLFNEDRRAKKIREENNLIEPKGYTEVTRTIKSTNNFKEDAKIYLKELYINTDKMFCQICENSEAIKYKNEFYFETVLFLDLIKDNKSNYLCLCANCSTKIDLMKNYELYQEYFTNQISNFDLSKYDTNDKIELKINNDEIDFKIEPKINSINFAYKHIFDIKVILELE